MRRAFLTHRQHTLTMRILQVSSSYPLTEGDATAPFMEEMATALVDRSHAVRIIVPNVVGLETGLRNGVEVESFRYAPARFESFGFGQSMGPDGRIRPAALAVTPTAMAAMAAAVRRDVARWRPDVVHLHWLLPQGAIGPALGRSIPVVVSLHGADVALAGRSALFRMVARKALRRADHLVAAAMEMFEAISLIEPGIKDRATVIPHGANAELFAHTDRVVARQSLGLAEDGLILLSVGRLVAKKGFDYLLRAMARLDDPAIRLFIAGDGPLRSELEALSGERSNISFLGEVDRSRLASWFAASDLVVVPSRRDEKDLDSGPVVLVEAMASGRGVISTPVGMAPDVLVDGENGFLVAESDPAALAAAITRALPEADRLGAAALSTFQQLGDWSRVAAQLEAVYDKAIAHRRATT